MTNKFKQGDQVTLREVTRKYACKQGTVVAPITLYTDNQPLYPDIKDNSDVVLFFDDAPDRQPINGYYVNARNLVGDVREKVIVTEEFLRKN
jgi:hypothetical protein